MNFIKINLADRHLIRRIVEIIFEQLEVTLEDFTDQVHRQIVEIILNRMRAFRAVAFTFIEAGNGLQINGIGCLDRVEDILHVVVKAFGPDDLAIGAAVDDKGADVTRLTRPDQ